MEHDHSKGCCHLLLLSQRAAPEPLQCMPTNPPPTIQEKTPWVVYWSEKTHRISIAHETDRRQLIKDMHNGCTFPFELQILPPRKWFQFPSGSEKKNTFKKEKRINKMFTRLSWILGCILFVCFLPIGNDPKKTHTQTSGTHPIPGQSRKFIYVCVFSLFFVTLSMCWLSRFSGFGCWWRPPPELGPGASECFSPGLAFAWGAIKQILGSAAPSSPATHAKTGRTAHVFWWHKGEHIINSKTPWSRFQH